MLDSFALLAFLRKEGGEAVVRRLLHDAERQGKLLHMTEVNYAEVKYITLRKSGREKWRRVERLLPTLPIEFLPFSRSLSDTAAEFKAKHSMSLADACAAALAHHLGAELVTGDREFEALENVIKVLWLKPLG